MSLLSSEIGDHLGTVDNVNNLMLVCQTKPNLLNNNTQQDYFHQTINPLKACRFKNTIKFLVVIVSIIIIMIISVINFKSPWERMKQYLTVFLEIILSIFKDSDLSLEIKTRDRGVVANVLNYAILVSESELQWLLVRSLSN